MIVSGLVHVAIATLCAFVLSWINGALNPWIAAASLIIGFLFAWRTRPRLAGLFEAFEFRAFSPGGEGRLERVLFVLILFFSYRHFAWLLFPSGGELKTLSLNNFGDLPLHLNYIRSFLHGVEFPPTNPGYSLELLRYPYGVDFYSALWEAVGVRTEAHLLIFGLFSAVAALVALRAWAGWWGIGGFFFSGGWAGWELLKPGNTTPVPDSAIAWKNLFLSVFITQRGMLFALPVGLLLLSFARRTYRGELKPTTFQVMWMGFLWGALAIFHLHAFFIVSILLGALALIYHGRAGSLSYFKNLLIPAVPIGFAFTLFLSNGFQRASVARWKPGWMAGPEGFARFAWFNFGPWLILVALLPLLIVFLNSQKERRSLLLEWGLYLGLFALFLNLILAPWEWDNIKLLIWPYLGFLALTHGALGSAATTHPAVNASVQTSIKASAKASAKVKTNMSVFKSGMHWGVAVVLLFSGLVTVALATKGTDKAPIVYSLEALSSTEGAIVQARRDAVFATAPTHDHPLAYFGIRRALGYEGHLWSHGINPTEARKLLDEVMCGKANWEQAARTLKVRYIFWGPVERKVCGENQPSWKSVLSNLSSVAGYEVYEIPNK